MELNKASQTLELLRDLLKIYSGFVRELGAIEREHDIDASNLGNLFGSSDFSAFFSSLVTLGKEQQLAFITLLGRIAAFQQHLANPMALKPSDKLALATLLDTTVKELEDVIGVSKVVNRPLDIDKQLVERCSNKDYHDVITNAFPTLEDKLRDKTGLDPSYYGDKLVDAAFNPTTGKLVLGNMEAEKQGVYMLLKGTFSFLRNPPAHTLTVDEGRSAAVKIMYMVDFLIKLIEKAPPRSTSPSQK